MRLLLSLCVALLLAGANGQFEGLGGGTCKSFKCTEGKVPVPKRPMQLTSPGCGGGLGSMAMFSPADATDPAVVDCCNQRHACLGICGASKKRCEESFKKCATDACETMEDEEAKNTCQSSAELHVLFAGMAGCAHFDKSQSAACNCVDEEKATEDREQSLADFYATWPNLFTNFN